MKQKRTSLTGVTLYSKRQREDDVELTFDRGNDRMTVFIAYSDAKLLGLLQVSL